MSIPRVPLLDQAKLNSSLQELASSADKLNSLSDQLTKQIAEVESYINKMGIGLTASVITEEWCDETGLEYNTWRICYEKYSGKWGLTIDHLWGHENVGEGDSETWLFKDAPREHRLKAIEKIPALVDALVKKSQEFASDISATLSYAEGLAAAFNMQNAMATKK